MLTNVRGAIFDMDGTLVDSLFLWDIIWEKLGSRFLNNSSFRPTEEENKKVRTMLLMDCMNYIHEAYGMGDSGKELFDFTNEVIIDFYKNDVKLKDGVLEFLEYCYNKGIKMCIASASEMRMIEYAAEHCKIKKYFKGFLSCTEIGKGKDEPDIYMNAMEFLGTTHEETCIFEDSLVAISTAKKLNMKTVGIFDKYNYGHEEMKKITDFYINDGETLMKIVIEGKMDYNFHTHTYLSMHASGTPEEYVLNAIEGGIKYYGFSDHAAFNFPDGHDYRVRVPVSQLGDYKKIVFDLREKYKDKIEIFFGFEMEYYPKFFEQMLKIAKDAGAEYLILGQHFLFNEEKKSDEEISAFRKVKTEEEIVHFADCIVNAIKSGVFTYVAHPDTIDIEDDAIYQREMQRICKASKEYDIPLEINFQGIREQRHYPKEKFWEIAGKTGCPVTFGFDSHQAHAACDLESLPKAMAMVEKFNLNYIGKPKLKRL